MSSHKSLFSRPVHAIGLFLGMLSTLCASAQTMAQNLAPIIVQADHDGLSAPTASQLRQVQYAIPGANSLVKHSQWQDTPASTLKDMLDYTAGVFIQPKWGSDARLSIRGSGLSRYYHLRGISLLQDGMPLNNADGAANFQAVDPSLYAYTQVFKGANALQYGAGSLGGAINFISPTGLDDPGIHSRVDIGSFAWRRAHTALGHAEDNTDMHLGVSWQEQDGFREQSKGHALRAAANVGWRISPSLDTRWYIQATRVRQQIPGTLSKEQALTEPWRANPYNAHANWSLNTDTWRIANRTVLRTQHHRYEGGIWYEQQTMHHPIYEYLQHHTDHYGAYARLEGDAQLLQQSSRYTLGLNWAADRAQLAHFENVKGHKAALLSRTQDQAQQLTLYAQNDLSFATNWQFITGLQYFHTQRKRDDRYSHINTSSRTGRRSYQFFNPKIGLLWQAQPNWQIYSNISRSGEAPTFGDMQFSTQQDLQRLQAQRATSYELGTRGQHANIEWDIAAYRTQLSNEFQCTSVPWNICDSTINIDRSVHQGLEASLFWTFAKSMLTPKAGGDWLTLQTSYTLNDFRFQHDPQWGNNQLPGAPKHYVRSELLYHHPWGFYIGPNVEWVPQAYYADNANTLKTTAYTLWGLRAGLTKKHYSVYIEGRNLSNRYYISSASTTDRATPQAALFEPGSARAIYVGIQMNL